MGPQRLNWVAEPWSDSEELECAMVIPETADCFTFAFRSPSGAWFDYQPGQFLTLGLPVNGSTLQRTFTISSSPSRPLSISVTVKVQKNSVGSRWMLDHLRPGMRLKAYGPAGYFSSLLHPARKYLFISAGSGITPMMSMTTWAWDSGEMPDIVFVHAARKPSNMIFRRRLEQFASRVPGLQLRFTVKDVEPFEVWTGYRGRLSQIMLGLMAHDYLEREIFCCGPGPFMLSVREMLVSLGFAMVHYHEESFSSPVMDEPPITPEVLSPEVNSEITFVAAGKTVRCESSETVLAVSRRSGLNIPSGCNFGLCGTCKIRKTFGEVTMVHNGGITDDEILEGYILACCSRPKGAVTIDL